MIHLIRIEEKSEGARDCFLIWLRISRRSGALPLVHGPYGSAVCPSIRALGFQVSIQSGSMRCLFLLKWVQIFVSFHPIVHTMLHKKIWCSPLSSRTASSSIWCMLPLSKGVRVVDFWWLLFQTKVWLCLPQTKILVVSFIKLKSHDLFNIPSENSGVNLHPENSGACVLSQKYNLMMSLFQNHVFNL